MQYEVYILFALAILAVMNAIICLIIYSEGE